MAIINNIFARLTSFKVNGVESALVNNIGTYGTYDVLNGGELIDNTLLYSFSITGLQNHTISSIIIKAILLNDAGELCESRRITTRIVDFGNPITQNFEVSDAQLIKIPLSFSNTVDVDTNEFTFDIEVSTTETRSVYYAITEVSINLEDVAEVVVLSFSGPATSRSARVITVAPLIKVLGTEAVTFSKDPTLTFDPSSDNVEGRIYFRREGIYVDNYKYGTVAPATTLTLGLVKLFDNFEVDAEDGGIIAPEGNDLAATPQLVYNAIASVKNYVDELADGITAPDIFIEQEVEHIDEETGESTVVVEDVPLLEAVRFSDDFEAKEENRIYIKWLDIV